MMFYDTYLYLFASDSLPSNVCNSVLSIVAELRVYQSVTKMTNVGRLLSADIPTDMSV
jgi:hypothetical protein